MRIVVCLLFALMLPAAPASASVKLWLAGFSSTGLDADDERELRQRVWEELNAAGAADVGADVDQGCVKDAGCVAARLPQLDAELALEVRLIRAGPLLQVSTLVHRDGAEPSRQERLVQIADLDAGHALLPDELLQQLRAAAAAGASPSEDTPANATTPPAETPPSDGSGGEIAAKDTTDDERPSPAAKAAPEDEAGPPLLGISGLGIAAVGLVVAVLGSAIAASGNEVLLEPTSSAEDKAQASIYGPIAIGAAVAGGAIALVGGVVATIGLWDVE